MRSVIVLLSVVGLSACQTDRTDTTTFRMRPEGEFEYKALAGPDAGLNDQAAERRRLKMLEEWQRENAMCQRGYTIVSRIPIKISQALFGPVYDVNYTGRCN